MESESNGKYPPHTERVYVSDSGHAVFYSTGKNGWMIYIGSAWLPIADPALPHDFINQSVELKEREQ